MRKRHILRTALAGVVGAFAVAGVAQADSNNCGRPGAWFGAAPDIGVTWLGVHTPGVNATVGQLDLEWTKGNSTFGVFPPGTELTNSRGVWEKVKAGTYKYTHISYGRYNGAPIYAMRISGLLANTDCDHATITYKLEIFAPAASMDSGGAPVMVTSGTGTETRMQLVEVTP